MTGTRHGVRGPCGVVCHRTRFLKIIFLTTKLDQIGQAEGSLNVQENLVINLFSIWAMIKVYINCAICLKNSYIWKISGS